MKIFGDGEEVQRLRDRLHASEEKRKELAGALAAERKRVARVGEDWREAKAAVERAKLAVQSARKRQKASVERAARFKARADTPIPVNS